MRVRGINWSSAWRRDSWKKMVTIFRITISMGRMDKNRLADFLSCKNGGATSGTSKIQV